MDTEPVGEDEGCCCATTKSVDVGGDVFVAMVVVIAVAADASSRALTSAAASAATFAMERRGAGTGSALPSLPALTPSIGTRRVPHGVRFSLRRAVDTDPAC